MKIHFSLVQAIIQALKDIFCNQKYSDKTIEYLFKKHPQWGKRDRQFIAESIYEIIRHYSKLIFLAELTSQPQTDLDFFKLWQLQFLLKQNLSSESFEILHSFVQNKANLLFKQPLKRDLLNINKNHLIYRLNELQKQPPWIIHSWPQNIDQELSQFLPQRWHLLREFLNQPAPVDLRVNTLKADRKTVIESLAQDQIEALIIPDLEQGLTLKERKNVFISRAFKKGLFEVQDRASQKIVPILNPQPFERICDACAGAGGKTLHIANYMNNKGRIIAMDIHLWKLNELRIRARRQGITIIEPRLIDSSKVIKRQKHSFDRVLLDVPCSGLGVVRRNPDTKWKLTSSKLKELIELQKYLLTYYSSMVKPGGILVYATCSIHPEENENQIHNFLHHHFKEWELELLWNSFPEKKEGDGFFAARLKKNNII